MKKKENAFFTCLFFTLVLTVYSLGLFLSGYALLVLLYQYAVVSDNSSYFIVQSKFVN